MKVYITIGLPGSGKSTWAKYKAQEDSTIKIISKDKLREMVAGCYRFDKFYEDLIEELFRSCLKILLCRGFDVVVDECHPTKEERHQLCIFIKTIVPDSEIIYVYSPMSPVDALAFRLREPKFEDKDEFVWGFVVDRIAKSFEEPILLEESNFVQSIITLKERHA